MKKTLKYLLAIISILFLIILIIFIVLNIIGLKRREPIKVFNHYYSLVVSSSMEDEIKKGDFIIYRSAEEYHEDDVIVYKSRDKEILIVHKIIKETDEGFITKGVNNANDDFQFEGYITNDRIIGKVTKILPLFGIGKLFVNNQQIIVLLVIITSTIFIIWSVIDIIKIYKTKEEKEA